MIAPAWKKRERGYYRLIGSNLVVYALPRYDDDGYEMAQDEWVVAEEHDGEIFQNLTDWYPTLREAKAVAEGIAARQEVAA